MAPQAPTPQSLCPRALTLAVNGLPHPPSRDPFRCSGPSLGQEAIATVAPKEPHPSWRNPGPEKPPGFEAQPRSAHKFHSFLLGTTTHQPPPAQGPHSSIPVRSHRWPRKVHRAPSSIAMPSRQVESGGRALRLGKWGGTELPARTSCLLRSLLRNARHWPPPCPARPKGREDRQRAQPCSWGPPSLALTSEVCPPCHPTAKLNWERSRVPADTGEPGG